MVVATVPVHVSSRLRLTRSDLPEGVEESIKDYLSFENGEKIALAKQGVQAADDMPDTIDLWSHEGEELSLPRGFAARLADGLQAGGHDIRWDDATTGRYMQLGTTASMRSIELRDYQETAAREMIESRQGIYQAPTGAGKTVAVLEVIRRIGGKALIVVGRVNLAEQWRKRAAEHLGIEIGMIGDGHWDERDVAVAVVQTLWSRRSELDRERWWERHRVVNFDEIHHGTSDTWQAVIERFSSAYIMGTTATPRSKRWTFPMLEALIGPIFHMTPRDELREQGVLLTPRVEVVKTGFNYRFRSSSIGDDGRATRSNYPQMLKALKDNEPRNETIATNIMRCSGRRNLVLSRQKQHLIVLRTKVLEMGWPPERAAMLTGDEDQDERARVTALAHEPDTVIFSTIADEGLDIPPLDRLHRTFPTRDQDVVEQEDGRVLRQAESKDQPVIYDYADVGVGVLKSQFFSRLDFYRERGYEVSGWGDDAPS